jgi:hypothetical protein
MVVEEILTFINAILQFIKQANAGVRQKAIYA